MLRKMSQRAGAESPPCETGNLESGSVTLLLPFEKPSNSHFLELRGMYIEGLGFILLLQKFILILELLLLYS